MLCKSCLTRKDEGDFYKSNKSRCRECVKASARQHRLENMERYRSYDKARASNPERVAARKSYSKTPEGKLAGSRAKKKWAVSNAHRRKANIAVGNAIRSGRLIPQPCFICGKKAEAHHPDYSQPLSVTWLCPLHHKEAHKITAKALYEAGEKETMHY